MDQKTSEHYFFLLRYTCLLFGSSEFPQTSALERTLASLDSFSLFGEGLGKESGCLDFVWSATARGGEEAGGGPGWDVALRFFLELIAICLLACFPPT